jgi:hypothetical protein
MAAVAEHPAVVPVGDDLAERVKENFTEFLSEYVPPAAALGSAGGASGD